jgi:hypothetical protein
MLRQRAKKPAPQGSYCKNYKYGHSAPDLKTEPFWKTLEGLEEESQSINKSCSELKD